MQIDYNSYLNMDVEDLNKIIEHAKNIIHVRENALVEAIKSKDLHGLQDALQYNNKNILPEKAWEELTFTDIKSKDWDFFNFIVGLPQYEEMNKKLKSNNGLTKTQEAVVASFADKKLFDLFMADPTYKNIVKDLGRYHAVEETTSKEVISALLENNILHIGKNLLNQAISRQKGNFIEYFIENNSFEFNNQNCHEIYQQGWSYLNDKALDVVKEKYPGYKYLSLDMAIKNLSNGFSSKAYYEQYKQFIKLEKSIILRTLNTHEVFGENVHELIRVFNNLSPTQNDKFMDVAKTIVDNNPEYLELFKNSADLATNRKFKNVYIKTIECLELHSSLEHKDLNNKSKLKI